MQLKDRIKRTAEAEGLTMPDLIRQMLRANYPDHPDPVGSGEKEEKVDKLLEIIDRQLGHQAKQKHIDYSRGFVRGLEWTKSEIRKVFER